jgi:hypothetical protein
VGWASQVSSVVVATSRNQALTRLEAFLNEDTANVAAIRARGRTQSSGADRDTRTHPMTWIVRNVMWIMVISGVLTFTMIYAALLSNVT